jgi:4-amino-4-deoxy-L-arabinose transferase-like glycosyltransferase
MINIDPPNFLEWMLLLLVGALAGAVNALRRYATKGTPQALIVGAVEGATALFATIVTFLILHSFLPAMFGIQIPVLGMIGLSGAVAHIGLRQTIRLVLRIAENTTRE